MCWLPIIVNAMSSVVPLIGLPWRCVSRLQKQTRDDRDQTMGGRSDESWNLETYSTEGPYADGQVAD